MTFFNGIQSFFRGLGAEGCYMLQLLYAGEKITGTKRDVMTLIQMAIESRAMTFEKTNYIFAGNYWVQYPKKLLSYVFGGTWDVIAVTGKAKPTEDKNTFIIYKWEYKDANGTNHMHFNSPEFESVQNPQCVLLGSITESRIIKKIS